MARRSWMNWGLPLALVLLLAVAAHGEGRSAGNGIYGQELMTIPEREAYRQKVWELKTQRERENYRDQHRQAMQERARNRGLPLPQEDLPHETTGQAPTPRWAPDDGVRRLPDGTAGDGLQRREAAPPAWGGAPAPR